LDTIFIHELRLPAWVGLYRHEKLAQQTIEIDLEIALPPNSAAFKSDKVADTIDYGVVVARIRELLDRERFGLVERLAERIAEILLDDFKSPHIKISIAKPGALRETKRVGVMIERSRG